MPAEPGARDACPASPAPCLPPDLQNVLSVMPQPCLSASLLSHACLLRDEESIESLFEGRDRVEREERQKSC